MREVLIATLDLEVIKFSTSLTYGCLIKVGLYGSKIDWFAKGKVSTPFLRTTTHLFISNGSGRFLNSVGS